MVNFVSFVQMLDFVNTSKYLQTYVPPSFFGLGILFHDNNVAILFCVKKKVVLSLLYFEKHYRIILCN